MSDLMGESLSKALLISGIPLIPGNVATNQPNKQTIGNNKQQNIYFGYKISQPFLSVLATSDM